jgi:hypothetical protein
MKTTEEDHVWCEDRFRWYRGELGELRAENARLREALDSLSRAAVVCRVVEADVLHVRSLGRQARRALDPEPNNPPPKKER